MACSRSISVIAAMTSRDIYPTQKESERAKPVNPKGGEIVSGSNNLVAIGLRSRDGKGPVANEIGKANNAKTVVKRSQEIKRNLSEHASQSRAPLNNPSPVAVPFQSPVPAVPPHFQAPGSSSSLISGSPGECQFIDDHFDTSSAAKVIPFDTMLVDRKASPNNVQTPASSTKSRESSAASSMNDKIMAIQKYSPFLDLSPSPKTSCANEKKEVHSEERITSHTPPQLRSLADELAGGGKCDPAAAQQDAGKLHEEKSNLYTTMREASKCEVVKGNVFADTCRLFLVAVLASTCTLGAVLMLVVMSVWSEDQDTVFGPLPT